MMTHQIWLDLLHWVMIQDYTEMNFHIVFFQMLTQVITVANKTIFVCGMDYCIWRLFLFLVYANYFSVVMTSMLLD